MILLNLKTSFSAETILNGVLIGFPIPGYPFDQHYADLNYIKIVLFLPYSYKTVVLQCTVKQLLQS